MESSIAEFLMRQFAFEQLPTYRRCLCWLRALLIYVCVASVTRWRASVHNHARNNMRTAGW